jgi:hypothetical protein
LQNSRKPALKVIQLHPANNSCVCGTGDSNRKRKKLPENNLYGIGGVFELTGGQGAAGKRREDKIRRGDEK